MNADQVYQSSYFRAEDLDGKSLPVVIETVEVRELGKNKESKLVVGFEGQDKLLPLNKINYKSIRKNYGKQTEDWLGKPIVLIPSATSFGGDTVDCIRLRISNPAEGANPAEATKPVEAAFDDDIPF